VKALVTDAHLRSSVAGIRALGAGGVPVVAAATNRSAAGLWSRYAGARATMPASSAPAELVDALGALAAQHGRLAVYPGQESTVGALIEHADRLSPDVVSPYGEGEGPRRLREKPELAELAAAEGLEAPRTLASGSASELAAMSLPAPCAVKPVRPGGVLASTQVVEDGATLAALLQTLPPDEPLLIQDHVGGPLTAIGIVVDREGAVVARFQQEARRTWPPGAGASAVAVSVAPDDDLVARGAALLRRVGYSGLAQLQFLRGPRGPALIDVNPRFYGSLPLAFAAGVNLPAAWHAVVSGGPLPTPGPYRVGVNFRWLEADLMAAVDGSPRALLHRVPRPSAGAVWATGDPVPGTMLAWHAVASRVPKLARRLATRRR